MLGIFSKQRRRVLGIELSSQAVKVVELSQQRNGFELESYAIECMPTSVVLDQTGTEPKSVAQTLINALRKAGAQASNVVTALPDTHVICKTFEIEAGLTEDELEFQVRLEAEQCVPYALEEAALDFEVQGYCAPNPDRVDVLLVACRLEEIEWRQAVLLSAGLTVHVIDVQAHALARSIDRMMGSHSHVLQYKPVAVVEFAPATTMLSVQQQGRVLYARELLFGHASQEPDAFSAGAVEHLGRGLELFSKTAAGAQVNAIVLCGTAPSMPQLQCLIEQSLGVPTHIGDPFVGMTFNPKLALDALLCDAPLLMTACGLALRGFD